MAVFLFSFGACGSGPEDDRYQEAVLRLEAEATRPLWGRLSRFSHRDYRPAPGVTRGGGGSAVPLRGGGENHASWLTAREREARAVEWLLSGHVGAAVEELERTVAELPEDARALNNLAALQLERALREDDRAKALEALGAAAHSLRVAPSAEARWNRALALSVVALPREADRAWREVLEQERDPAWEAEAREIIATVAPPPARRLATLVDGHVTSPSTVLEEGQRELEAAMLLQRSEDYRGAAAAYARARAHFETAGSPLALVARLGVVQSSPVSWPELDELGRLTSGRGDYLEAAVLRQRGFRNGREGRSEAALADYFAAEARFEALDHEESALAAVMSAELHAELDQPLEAQAALSRGFSRAVEVADPLNRYALFVVAASALRLLGEPWAAVEARREAAGTCVDLPERPLCPVDSAISVVDLLQELPGADPPEIEAELDRLESLLAGAVGAEDGRRGSLADLTAARSRWLGDPNNPHRDLEAALDRSALARAAYLEQQRYAPLLRATNDAAGWLAELERSAELEVLLEEARKQAREGAKAVRSLGSSLDVREIYERLIELRLATGADDEALAMVEEIRSLGRSGGTDPGVRTTLPTDMAVAVYWTSDERSVAWLVTARGTTRIDLEHEDSKDLALRLTALSEVRNVPAWRRLTGEIHDRWLAPIVDQLPPGVDRLVVVPDRGLTDIPYRALWDERRQRYLEDALVIELESQLSSIDAAPPPVKSVPRSILGFGVSRFAPALGLDDLAEAAGEAADVTRGYFRSLPCAGLRWEDFRSCAAGAEVIHLATHAQSREDDGRKSWIAFHDQTVSLERLAQELPPLPATRLVVLSACQSSSSAGGSLGGLAPPFLAAGAGTVVGSLWPIEDTALLRRFMSAFHHSYRRSGEAARALGEARASSRDIAERPWLWGAFTVVTHHPTGVL